jgi:hypothetical protein
MASARKLEEPGGFDLDDTAEAFGILDDEVFDDVVDGATLALGEEAEEEADNGAPDFNLSIIAETRELEGLAEVLNVALSVVEETRTDDETATTGAGLTTVDDFAGTSVSSSLADSRNLSSVFLRFDPGAVTAPGAFREIRVLFDAPAFCLAPSLPESEFGSG